MDARERALLTERLRQVVAEVGLKADEDRLGRFAELMISTVDGVRAAGALGLAGIEPAFVPNVAEETA